MIKNVVIFTKNNCEWCVRVKKVLESIGVTFEERNIDEDYEALMGARARKFKTMPQVMIDQAWIGGCEDTVAHLRRLGYELQLE